MKYFLVYLVLALATATPATAQEALDELFALLEPLAQLQGEFTQLQYDDRGASLGESRGTFRVLRPDYFAWDISAPDSQLVIAGPEFLWHHDRDLDTVTRRRVDTTGGITPLEILAGDRDAIVTRLQVSREADGFLLQPSAGEDVGFSRLLLRFEGDRLAGMDVLDNLDQRLVIAFSALDLAPGLTAADFAFVAPPDADLFYHD
ncbi:MAG: hypothetical protein HKN19_12605 [Halioglobus sp.]|nr:hypothetical protein [Halioglobus sp.]